MLYLSSSFHGPALKCRLLCWRLRKVGWEAVIAIRWFHPRLATWFLRLQSSQLLRHSQSQSLFQASLSLSLGLASQFKPRLPRLKSCWLFRPSRLLSLLYPPLAHLLALIALSPRPCPSIALSLHLYYHQYWRQVQPLLVSRLWSPLLASLLRRPLHRFRPFRFFTRIFPRFRSFYL